MLFQYLNRPVKVFNTGCTLFSFCQTQTISKLFISGPSGIRRDLLSSLLWDWIHQDQEIIAVFDKDALKNLDPKIEVHSVRILPMAIHRFSFFFFTNTEYGQYQVQTTFQKSDDTRQKT